MNYYNIRFYFTGGSLDLPDDVLQEYRELFSYFDRDGGGSIGVDELGQVMRAFNWTPTDSQLKVGKVVI